MNKHALRTLARAIAGCEAGYSTGRTCEIGLSVHGGVPYRSIANLVDSVAEPRRRAEAADTNRRRQLSE
jgi:D-lactate dehydrogenase